MKRIRGSTLTVEAQRELEAVDAALAGNPVAAEHDSLARFARELRATRPLADEQFLATLDARAGEGFEGGAADRAHRPPVASRLRLRERGRTVRGRVRLGRLGARPALGVALVGILALAVALPFALQGGRQGGIKTHSLSAGRAESPTNEAQIAPAERAERGAEAEARARVDKLGTSGASAAGSVLAPAPSAAAPARQVERTATLDVGVAPGAVDSKAHQAFTLVSSYGGYVRTSNVSAGSGQGGASFDIRVPTTNLSAMIGQLAGLGHVRAENNTTNDVTEQFDSLQHSLGDLRAERASLLKQIAQASESAKAEELKARLRNVEAALGHDEGSLRALKNRVDYTPLALTLTPEAGPASRSNGELTPGSAAHDAGRILEAALAVLVIAAAALLPLGALALAARVILGAGRRRLREHA